MSAENCNFCQQIGGQPQVFFRVEGAKFYRCRRCGLVWLEHGKRPADQASYYSEEYYPKGYAGRENIATLFRYRFKLFREYLTGRGKLLEVGAASGDFLHLMQDIGFEVYGVELSKRAAEQASRLYGLSLSEGTLEEAHFSNDFFDVVVLYHVLEHVLDPRATLREIHRILKPGGKVLIEVPNVQSIDALSKPLLRSILDYPNHLYAFTPSLLSQLVKDAGFSLVTIERSFPFLFAQFIKKIRSPFFSKQGSMDLAHEQNVPTGAKLLAQVPRDGFVKRAASRVFPGMKVTIIAQK